MNVYNFYNLVANFFKMRSVAHVFKNAVNAFDVFLSALALVYNFIIYLSSHTRKEKENGKFKLITIGRKIMFTSAMRT